VLLVIVEAGIQLLDQRQRRLRRAGHCVRGLRCRGRQAGLGAGFGAGCDWLLGAGVGRVSFYGR
jgi:hypothetical protein